MKLAENIYTVGATDADVRVFHGYVTPIGTTYNAYLVLDDQVTLIDTVKAKFAPVLEKNIKAILGDRKVDVLICNHVEPDHSGSLPEMIRLWPEAMVYGTANCEKELHAYYPDCPFRFTKVGAGDSIRTGKYSFHFVPMPMVHWPDSMSTYLPEERMLFSNDALGQHIGTGEVTDSDLTLEKLLDRAGDYYANIVLPYGPQVQKLLAQVSALDVGTICPSHGVVLRRYISQMVAKYNDWSTGKFDDGRCVIVYDTMWGTTRKLAAQLEKDYTARGIRVEVINLAEKHYSYAMTRLLEAKYILVGSPTLNNNMLPSVAAFLTYLKGLRPKNRTAMAFGSYGWSGESVPQINDLLTSCGFEMLPPLKAQWNTK